MFIIFLCEGLFDQYTGMRIITTQVIFFFLFVSPSDISSKYLSQTVS